jgi:hypothetical protein
MQDIPLYISLVYTMISWYIEYINVYTIYHGIYHNIFSSFISHCILVPSSPPCQGAALISLPLQLLWSGLLLQASIDLSTPMLSFFHSDPARLPLPIAPHPEVKLTDPASVASPHAGICSSSSPVPKAVGQGGMLHWYVTHSGASALSLIRSPWPGSSTASCHLAFR